MEKIYLNKRFLGLATLLLSSMGILTSCGSYQNNSYYDNDGIYNSNPEPMYTQRVRVGSTQSVDPNYNYNKYENYFAEAKNDYTVFTDTDNFTSEPNTAAYNNDGYVDYTQNQTYAERYGSFGQNSSSVTVNVYSDYGFGYNPYWGWGGYYGSYWGWRRPYVGLYWGSPYYYNNWYGPSWGYYGPNYYGGYYGGGYYGGGYYAPYRPAVVRGQGQRTGVVRNNSIAGPNTNNRVGVNRNPSGVNTVGSRPSNTNSGRVTTVRENGVARQAVLRDPSVINRAAVQNGTNTVRNNSNNTYNRTTTPQSSNNSRYNTTRGTSNGASQRTPSSGTINRGSSTPSRSYSPASSPSRGGSMGGGSFSGGARGGSSGGGVRR